MNTNKITEGGPGSGVAYKNTAPIDYPMSDYVSVGTRKGMLDNMDYEEYDIPVSEIKKVAQKSYVPEKVTRMMQNKDFIASKPIDVLWVRGEGYHMIDGHHRMLAASRLKMDTLPARVRKKSEKTMPDYVASNPDKDDDIEMATRTTADAQSDNGFMDYAYAGATYAENADWDKAFDSFRRAR